MPLGHPTERRLFVTGGERSLSDTQTPNEAAVKGAGSGAPSRATQTAFEEGVTGPRADARASHLAQSHGSLQGPASGASRGGPRGVGALNPGGTACSHHPPAMGPAPHQATGQAGGPGPHQCPREERGCPSPPRRAAALKGQGRQRCSQDVQEGLGPEPCAPTSQPNARRCRHSESLSWRWQAAPHCPYRCRVPLLAPLRTQTGRAECPAEEALGTCESPGPHCHHEA